ncbi:MAG: glutathione peroxidase [Planctomycetota bacterium]
MLRHAFLLTLAFGFLMGSASADNDCALEFKMKNIDGETVDLHDYEGNVVVIVNVASRCGLTPQYAGLQDLYEKYSDKGLVVLGFPCNEFAGQEPGSDSEIKQFCSTKYDVTFPMFSKIVVNDGDVAPLYKYLKEVDTDPEGAGRISWNFEKFLIGRDGKVAGRYSPRTKPYDESFIAAIEAELAK